MKTIVLKFSGPMQSWGTESHFETRHTDRYPSKSAVIGMMAASLGYRRYDDEKMAELHNLQFAVRIDQQGTILHDYHIARRYKDDGSIKQTYVTDRYYLEDAVFVVALSHENNAFIQEIEYALKHPYFQPFMGRRSLPLPADFFLGCYSSSLIDTLKSIPWQAAPWYQKNASGQVVIYADSECLDRGLKRMRKDRVLSFSQKNRRFGFRSETRNELQLSKGVESEHDALSALGGSSDVFVENRN